MKKLDYELTRKLFECKDEADIKSLVESGADLETASRLSLDEVLAKVFNRTCHGTKDLAIKMLEGELRGEHIPDVADTNVQYEKNVAVVNMDPEERKQRIKARLEDYTRVMPKYWEYSKKVIKDPELRVLGATEEDIKFASIGSEVVICGKDRSNKLYICKNEPQYVEECLKADNVLYYTGDEQ